MDNEFGFGSAFRECSAKGAVKNIARLALAATIVGIITAPFLYAVKTRIVDPTAQWTEASEKCIPQRYVAEGKWCLE